MGEALLIKASGSGNSSRRTGLVTEIFTSNTLWKVPEGIRNNQVSVRIFGGGGAGTISNCVGYMQGVEYAGCGGGGGYMNYNIVTINEPEVLITIGNGGMIHYNILNITSYGAGSSFFGRYLSANGADRKNGGSGGGGYPESEIFSASWHGGDGSSFGGGGCGYYSRSNSRYVYANERNATYIHFGKGGNGGPYGGGGGGIASNNSTTEDYIDIGRGGIYGGNGGYFKFNRNSSSAPIRYNAETGYNLQKDSDNLCSDTGFISDNAFRGNGAAGVITGDVNNYSTCGGGGGGCGGKGGNVSGYSCSGGGGGGLGANGADGCYKYDSAKGIFYCTGGGGGGGYCGGDGGKGSIYGGGGGGGYGIYGKGGGWTNADGTGYIEAGLAAGGGGLHNGGPGVCIIQYYLD